MNSTQIEPSLKVLRNQLGSVDLSDVDEEMTEQERKEYVAVISAVFPRIEKDIKKFLYDQLLFISNKSENWDHVLFGRGTFNGMSILLEHWKQAHVEHESKSKKEEFNKTNILPEL